MSTCAKCNRPLSNPQSIQQGYGPICYAEIRAQSEAEQQKDTDRLLDIQLYPLDESVVLIRDEQGIKTNVPRIIERHSPNGYEWGYAGSGPADLALNIIEYYVRVLRNEGVEIGNPHKMREGVAHDLTLWIYQDFKCDFIATAPTEGRTIEANTVISWIKANHKQQLSMF